MSKMANHQVRRALAATGWTLSVCLTLLTSSGRAEQSSAPLRGFYAVPAAQESLADEYGQAVIGELARLMTLRADAACLKSRNVSEGAFRKVASDILTRYGGIAWPLLYPDVSDTAVQAEFSKIAGPQAVPEMQKFAVDPEILRLRALALPRTRDDIVDAIAMAFDQYLGSVKLTLGQPLSPLDSGNDDLLQLAEKRDVVADDEKLKANWEQAWAQRFLELNKALITAVGQVAEAAGKGLALPHSAFKGVETDLRNVCVRLEN